jgi:hypothetical protein
VGLLAEDIGLLNEKGSALRLGAATQLVVRRVVAANNGHGTRASGEVDLSEIMKRKRRLGP